MINCSLIKQPTFKAYQFDGSFSSLSSIAELEEVEQVHYIKSPLKIKHQVSVETSTGDLLELDKNDYLLVTESDQPEYMVIPEHVWKNEYAVL